MRLDHVLDHVVELGHADDLVVEVFDLGHELLDICLDLAEDDLHGGLDDHLVVLVDDHPEVDLLLEDGGQQDLFLVGDVVGVVHVQLLERDQHVADVLAVLFLELEGEQLDVVDEVEGNGLQLVELQHQAQLVDQLQLLLYPYLFFEVDVEVEQVAEHLVHELEGLRDGQLELVEHFHRDVQQLGLDLVLVAFDFLGHAGDPAGVDVSTLVGDEEHVLELHAPAEQLLVVEEEQLLDLELVLHELDHPGALVPLVHELDGQVVPEEVVLLELAEDLVLVDELVERGHLSVAHHAVLADRDVVGALLLLVAHLELVNADHPHVEELLALRLLQHRHDLGDVEDLVLHEVGDRVVDRLLALHLYRRQHLNRLYALPHLPHVDDFLCLLLDQLRGVGLLLERGQPHVRDGPVPRTVQEAPLLVPALLPGSFFRGLVDDGEALHGGRVQLEGLKLDVEPILEPFLIDIH